MDFTEEQIEQKYKELRRAYDREYYHKHKEQRKESFKRSQRKRALKALQAEAEKQGKENVQGIEQD